MRLPPFRRRGRLPQQLMPQADRVAWPLAGRLAETIGPCLAGAYVLYLEEEGPMGMARLREWALERLAELIAAPTRTCPHAAQGNTLPVLACAWQGALSCADAGCMAQMTAFPEGDEGQRCDGCRRIGSDVPAAVIVASGGALLLTRLCPVCRRDLAIA
ncbi:hypothetical protein HRbin24_00091 [bacterium HR24]|nr:hypothetical protein HRbin24_00091 [bacterium HR24]